MEQAQVNPSCHEWFPDRGAQPRPGAGAPAPSGPGGASGGGVEKSLDAKLARIHADPLDARDFILCDAKDADMAFGIAAPGKSPEHYAHEARFRSLQEFRELIRQNVKQGLLDIVLMSASTNELLTIKERIFDGSHVTPAARANDATDIHAVTGGVYAGLPSRPFRTATIDHIMCGKLDCAPGERKLGADLGLYSMTFNNDLDADTRSLEAYADFRVEAEKKGFRHFLEVFNPNACGDRCPADLARYINDMIVRALAGVVGRARPVFLKIAYNGPAAMEQLASYDRSLVVGILGGSAGTTMDAFHQLWEARKHGARVALYGRMINNAENQLVFIQHLRWLADGVIDDPAEAVKSYHASLEKVGIKPYRSLADDLVPTRRYASYGEAATGPRIPGAGAKPPAEAPKPAAPVSSPAASAPAKPQAAGKTGEAVDFSTMTPAEKVAWNRARWDRVLGKNQ